MQAVFVFVAGWVALQWDASLTGSLSFLVLWAVVVPLLAGIALLATVGAVARALWAGCSRRAGSSPNPVHAAQSKLTLRSMRKGDIECE